MAVCNLFNTLGNPAGTFLMFSQYTEDLTKYDAQGHVYRVIPSSYLACNLNFSAIGGTLNESVPKFFQDKFENGCALGREKFEKWLPTYSTNVFWNALIDNKLINVVNNKVAEILYKGEISQQSYDIAAGMGYNGIYCYIPDSASKATFEVVYTQASIIHETKQLIGRNSTIPSTSYKYDGGIKIMSTKTEDKAFEANSIILLYDVEYMDENGSKQLFTDIPMGIYFPGLFEGKVMTNTIHKFYSNKAYGAGTSYGIRICSRMTPTAISDNISVNNEITGDSMGLMCQLLSSMSKNLNMMDKVFGEEMNDMGIVKDTMNIFQNSRTNVPYIVKVGSRSYWFVNGRNTGVWMVNGEDFIECDNNELKDLIENLMNGTYSFEIYCCDEYGYKSYEDCSKLNNNDIKIRVLLKSYVDDDSDKTENYEIYNDITSDIRYVMLSNGSETKPYTIFNPLQSSHYIINGQVEEGEYSVSILTNEDIKITESVGEKINLVVKRYWPIYTGLFKTTGDFDVNNINPNDLKSFISPSPYNKVYIDSDNNKLTENESVEKMNNVFIYMVPEEEYIENITHVINYATMDNIYNDFCSDTVNLSLNGQSVPYKIMYMEHIPFDKDIELCFTDSNKDYEMSIFVNKN